MHLGQLIDQLAKVNDSLADSDLQMLFVRVSKVNIMDVGEQFFEIPRTVGSVEVLAGVKAESQTFDVSTDDGDGIDIAREVSVLAPHADSNSIAVGNLSEAFKLLDFFVERGAMLAAGNGEGDYFYGLSQCAAAGELVEILFARRVELQTQPGEIQSADGIADQNCLVQIRQDFAGLEVWSVFVNRQLNTGVFEVGNFFNRLVKGEVGKTVCRGGNYQARTPWRIEGKRNARFRRADRPTNLFLCSPDELAKSNAGQALLGEFTGCG